MPTAARPTLEPLADRLAPAAVGAANLAFGTNGVVTTDLGGANDLYSAALPLGDGRTLAAGTDGGDFVVALYRPNGTLDTSFGTNGVTRVDFGGTDAATSLALDASGRPVVAGRTSVGVGGGDFAVVRLTADTGVVDTTFGVLGKRTVDLGAADVANGVTIDGTGRVLLAGSAGSQFGLARLDAAGTLDATFGANGIRTLSLGATETGRKAFVAPDGRIILVGSTTRSGGQGGIDRDFIAVKFNADGKSTDPTTGQLSSTLVGEDFGTTGFVLNGVTIRVLAIDFGGADELFGATVQPDGRYLVAGRGGAGVDFAAARFDSNGNLSSDFGTGGKVTVDFGGADRASGVAVQSDGRIVLGGTSAAASGSLIAAARLTSAGALDASYSGDGKATVAVSGTDGADAVGVSSTGATVLAGRSSADAVVVQLNGLVGVPSLLLTGGPADGSVKLFAPTGGQYAASGSAFAPFPGVASGVRVALADVNGDGVPERIAATGPGVAPQLAVYDGVTGKLIASQTVFEATYLGGVNVSAGDVDGDGKAEVAVSPDSGGGPRVRLLSGASLSTNQLVALQDFFAITDDPNFRGGVRTAIGDVDGDGLGDLLVSAGFGGGPRIALWSGAFLAAGKTPTKVVNDFFAFESTLRDGAFVAVGDLNGDNRGDLIFGGGPNGGPRVRATSGGALLGAGTFSNLDAIPAAQLANFFAGDPNTRGGVRVASRDADGDGLADLLAASGDNLPSAVRVYFGRNVPGLSGPTPVADQTLDPFAATLPGGVFVG